MRSFVRIFTNSVPTQLVCSYGTISVPNQLIRPFIWFDTISVPPQFVRLFVHSFIRSFVRSHSFVHTSIIKFPCVCVFYDPTPPGVSMWLTHKASQPSAGGRISSPENLVLKNL